MVLAVNRSHIQLCIKIFGDATTLCCALLCWVCRREGKKTHFTSYQVQYGKKSTKQRSFFRQLRSPVSSAPVPLHIGLGAGERMGETTLPSISRAAVILGIYAPSAPEQAANFLERAETSFQASGSLPCQLTRRRFHARKRRAKRFYSTIVDIEVYNIGGRASMARQLQRDDLRPQRAIDRGVWSR